jgi:F0F1-type ATP synthase membrane subunit c/vacuolar-type H+-ATPase subunit K
MALVMFFALTQIIGREFDADTDDRVLLLVLAVASLLAFALSFVLKAKLISQSSAQRRPDLATTAYIIAFALCESAAIFGLIVHFVTGVRESLYFFAPAALGLALHFPRRMHFEEPTRGTTFGEGA